MLKTNVVTAVLVAAVFVGLLIGFGFLKERFDQSSYRAACWSDADCGSDGRCDDTLGCVPRGNQPRVEKQSAGLLLETFEMQPVGAPLLGVGAGPFAETNVETDVWASTPAPAPLRPYNVADDNQLFEYQNNAFRPECCPATISADTGCVCLTKDQERQLATRGGNRVTLK